MPKANNIQHGGDHYKKKTIEPWDFIAANNIGFFEGNAIKYLTRWKDKGGIEDLKKANHYINKLIEIETGESPDTIRNDVSHPETPKAYNVMHNGEAIGQHVPGSWSADCEKAPMIQPLVGYCNHCACQSCDDARRRVDAGSW